jgi:hypothetical protein
MKVFVCCYFASFPSLSLFLYFVFEDVIDDIIFRKAHSLLISYIPKKNKIFLHLGLVFNDIDKLLTEF